MKKKNRSIQYFWKDSHITFQLPDKQWLFGVITKITPDSFYLTQEIIRSTMMGFDTLRMSGFKFSYNDVYALPTKKQMIYFKNDQVQVIAGHEKFVWVRNGTIFQLAGGGYVALNVVNDAIHGDPPFAKKRLTGLGIGAAVFLVGKLLQMKFYPYWKIGKKFKLEYMSFRNEKPF